MECWKLEEMVAMLPLLIQISLLLFAIGLVLFLFRISKPSFGVTTAIFGVGVLYYAVTTAISVFVTSSPFHSPLSRALGRVYQYVYAYFCPGLDEFLSPNMDITPATLFGRLRRHIQIFLQKSSPYLERDFVKPVTASTVDEVQLLTAASALQRVHDSVPDSQHSELIQRSVWQVAGGPVLWMRPFLELPSWILERGNDKEYFSWLSPASAIAFTSVFVRMHAPRYKMRIAGVEDRCRAEGDSQGSWDQLVHAIFDLLPDNFINNHYDSDDVRRACRLDALFCEALPDTPSIDTLLNNLLDASLVDPRFGSSLWDNFRVSHIRHTFRGQFRKDEPNWILRDLRNALCDALHKTPLHVIHAFIHDTLIGNAPLDDIALQGRLMRAFMTPEAPNELLSILRDNELHEDETMWLLSTLSGLHCDGLVRMKHHVSKICLAILLHQAPKWNQITLPDIMLIEAMITFAAISCSSNEIYQLKTFTNSHQHSWLLLNLRDPDLVTRTMDEIDDDRHEELISLLFLVIYALTLRGSKGLAELYLDIITARADFAFCASALSTIAPALGDDGFRAIRELLLAPQTQFLSPTAMSNNVSDFPQVRHSHQDLLNNYDLHLGASGSPDPKIAAILLLLFKGGNIREIGHDIALINPWLWCVANMLAFSGYIPHSHSMEIRSFRDCRVHNMFGALSLLQHASGLNIYDIPYPVCFLASFLEASNPAISCPVLYHYMEFVHYNTSPPSCYFSGALHIVFNPILPSHHLPRGWGILYRFLHKFDYYNAQAQQRQIFAEAFFGLSRCHAPMQNGPAD